MNGKNRSDIRTGTHVKIVQKQDQHTGKLTEGIVLDILTKSPGIPMASRYGCKTGRSAGSRKSLMFEQDSTNIDSLISGGWHRP